jgi:hypothetical protein
MRDKEKYTQYGLIVEEYDALLAKQGGCCAVCHKPETLRIKGQRVDLAVDHDHTTGKVRGLLCHLCSRGSGFFQGSPDRLRAMAAYLERHGQ